MYLPGLTVVSLAHSSIVHAGRSLSRTQSNPLFKCNGHSRKRE